MEQTFYTSRVKLWGGSYVILLPAALVKSMGYVHRDAVALRRLGRALLIKKLVPGEVIPVSAEEVAAAARDGRG